MDPSNNPSGESKTEVPLAPLSPSPTERDIGTTPPQPQAPLTHSFHPTAAALDEAFQADQPFIQLNTPVDGYVLLEKIGRGGMGIVFKAKQPGSGQIVALKMIREGVFADQESLDRFRQEITTLGQVHPIKNIVPIFHVGEFEGHSYYVMPYMPRGNVALHLTHFSENPRDAVMVVEKVARAVHQLHLTNIIHRDVKPGNILLDAEGEPYLSDFGLIKQLDHDQALTTTHQRLGTPAYMAPEQTGLLDVSVGRATDVWALGVVLYEMLTGVRPFTAPKGEETTTLLWRIVYQEPRGPRVLAPGIDRNLEAVILKCLEKHPANRYASAEELANELRRWLDHQPLITRPPSSLGLWWRRHPVTRRLAVAILMFVPALLAAVLVYRHLADPERPLREIQDEVQRHGRADLMRDEWPRWSRWSFQGSGTLAKSTDGFAQISSGNLGLLMLAKDIQGPGLLLKAKIRHDLAEGHGARVGLFVAHTPSDSEPTSPRIFYRCEFNDLQEDRHLFDIQKAVNPKINVENKGNLVYLGYVFYGEPKDREPFFASPNWGRGDPLYFKPVGSRDRTWRDVSLEFQGDGITATFNGKRTKTLSIATARKRLEGEIPMHMKSFPGAPPVHNEFYATGAMGLMVAGGSASFKDVTVEKLNPK